MEAGRAVWQWPEFTGLALGNVDPAHRAGSIGLLFEFSLNLFKIPFNSPGSGLDLLSVNPVYPAGFATARPASMLLRARRLG